jgi:hypothetical protein
MKILKLTAISGADRRGETAIYVVAESIFSFFSPPGTEHTVIKSVSHFEQVKETPEEILAMIGVQQ